MFLAFVCVCLFVLVRAETAGFAGLTNKPSANEAPANTASVPIDCLEELKSGNDGRTWALMLEYDEAELEKLGTELGSDLKSDLDLYASHMNYVDGGFGGESGTQVSTKCTGPTKYWTNGNIMGNDPNSEDETVTADILFVKNVKKESFSASFLKFGVSKESINGKYISPVMMKQVYAGHNSAPLPEITMKARLIQIDTEAEGLSIVDEKQLFDLCGDIGIHYGCIDAIDY